MSLDSPVLGDQGKVWRACHKQAFFFPIQKFYLGPVKRDNFEKLELLLNPKEVCLNFLSSLTNISIYIETFLPVYAVLLFSFFSVVPHLAYIES